MQARSSRSQRQPAYPGSTARPAQRSGGYRVDHGVVDTPVTTSEMLQCRLASDATLMDLLGPR